VEDEPPRIHKYTLNSNNVDKTDNSICDLEPNHTAFFFFDYGTDDGIDDVKNMLLKRHDIEHQLSISKALRSRENCCQSKSASMYCQ